MQKGFAENVLRAAAAEAHSAIVSHRTGRLGQMASTVASVWFQGRQASIAHVGDSRVYRMRKGILSLLTRDHSFYAELLMLGRDLPPRNEFPYKNQITRALGIDANPTADTATVDLEKGDRFLLCTDGLYDPFDDDTLANLMSSGSARDCCELLVEAAYLHGSLDNITAIVIDVT
jgi:serine/threonine protein phosphatase PrpC